MKENIEKSDVFKVLDKVADIAKYFCDKKAESAKNHDETLKEMNTKDNDTKKEMVKMVIGFAGPLVTAATALLVSKKDHL